MPGLFYQPITRRRFLAASAKAVSAVAVAVKLDAFGNQAAGSAAELRLALLSDTHIPADPKNEFRKFLPWENLQTIVPQVAQSQPAGVVICGDAARLSGELADYEELKKLLSPLAAQRPVYIGLGNHDNRDNFFKIFDAITGQRATVTDKHVLVVEHPQVRLLILDSLLYVNKVAGLLGKAQSEWLEGFLRQSDQKPIVLFVHHTLGDNDGDLLDVDRLFRIIGPHSKVKALFYGHSHEYSFRERQGIHLVNLPAVGYNFDDKEPVGWVEAVFGSKGVALTLRAFGGNRANDGKTTSISWRA
jgi:Icc protein